MLRSMIMDSYDWFVGLVDERRPLTRSEVAALADGSIFEPASRRRRARLDAVMTSSRNLTRSRFAPQYGYFGKFDQSSRTGAHPVRMPPVEKSG